jgi:hypothetical protein
MKLVFTAFKTFSENPTFGTQIIAGNHRANRNLELDKFRVNFLRCCINNSIQFLLSTVNTNEFVDEEE